MAMRSYGCVLIALTMAMPCYALADPLNDAQSAFDRGDYATAIPIWRELAGKGDPRAEFGLGVAYSTGKGVSVDCVEATKWIRKAAEQDFVLAEMDLEHIYAQCDRTPEWYRESAEKGNIESQLILGIMYSSGIRVPRDYAEAMNWLREAAAGGSAEAEGMIAALYAAGHGVPKDDTEAMSWFRRSADHGYWLAQVVLAARFAQSGNRVGAYEWFTVAASRNSGPFQNHLLMLRAVIAAQMTPDQLQKAEDLAREWNASHLPDHK